MIRGLKCLTLCLMALLVLSGCGQVEISTVINADGSSGTRRIAIAMDKATYKLLSAAGQDPFAELRHRADALGAQMEPYGVSNQVGVAYSFDFTDLTALNKSLGLDTFEQVRVWRDGWFLKPTYHFRAQVDTSNFPDKAVRDLGLDPTVDYVYSLVLPGEIIEHNATDVWGKNIVAWQFLATPGAVFDLYAVSQVDYTGAIPAVLVGLMGVLALILLSAFAIRSSRRT